MGKAENQEADGMAFFMSLGGGVASGEPSAVKPKAASAAMSVEVERAMSVARSPRTDSGPLLPRTHEATDVAPMEPQDPEGFAGVLARADRLLGRTYLDGLSARWPVLGGGAPWESWEAFFTAGRRQVALFRVRHLVFRPDEDPRERLKPLYLGVHGLHGSPSVFFVLDSDYDPLTR